MVCDAVQHAHRALVVHRDLKPSNIFVSRSGNVKLLDFGIAKLLDPDAWDVGSPATRAEMRLITPEYAAPEQRQDGPITTATDVYALGVVLYELLTGRRPREFGATNRSSHAQDGMSISSHRAERGGAAAHRPEGDARGRTGVTSHRGDVERRRSTQAESDGFAATSIALS